MRSIFLYLGLSIGLWAQLESPDLTADKIRTSRAAALAAIKADQGDTAEQELDVSALVKERHTPEARLERAQEFIVIAFQARSAGDTVTAQRAATRALRAVEKAEKTWRDQPKRLAELQLLRATLQEEFLGTSDDADAHVLEAARLDAENSTAGEKARRIKFR
jgi:uncharacterized Ntn-hydrolase superfamily protein